jgi:erythromycin esterase-like protein
MMNIRDRQMAINLKWLAENKYAGKKIIVWAANYHISKFNGHYSPKDFVNEAQTMGGVFTADSVWNKKTYILGFTSLNGTGGRLGMKTYNLPKPQKNSFERWIDAGYEYAFTDFKAYNEKHIDENFFMSGSIKGNNSHTHHQAQWNKIFDGVFFIKDMYTCRKVLN